MTWGPCMKSPVQSSPKRLISNRLRAFVVFSVDRLSGLKKSRKRCAADRGLAQQALFLGTLIKFNHGEIQVVTSEGKQSLSFVGRDLRKTPWQIFAGDDAAGSRACDPMEPTLHGGRFELFGSDARYVKDLGFESSKIFHLRPARFHEDGRDDAVSEKSDSVSCFLIHKRATSF